MQVSRLDGKPAGRQPVRTTLHSLATLPDVTDGIFRARRGGARVYWVCPLVAESEVFDVAAAEARFAELRDRFGAAVGLAHGRQELPVREAALEKFAAGRNPAAGRDHGDRGRRRRAGGDGDGGRACRTFWPGAVAPVARPGRARARRQFLPAAARGRVNEIAKRRLLLLRDTEDGFRIADEDFRLRGGGDLLGTRQSGAPGWRLADPVEDEGLLHMAGRDAELLLQKDPKLESERGRAVRVLLHLFERTAAMRTLRSG